MLSITLALTAFIESLAFRGYSFKMCSTNASPCAGLLSNTRNKCTPASVLTMAISPTGVSYAAFSKE